MEEDSNVCVCDRHTAKTYKQTKPVRQTNRRDAIKTTRNVTGSTTYRQTSPAGRPAPIHRRTVACVPVVGVFDTHSQLVTIVELLLEGRLHGLRMQHCGSKEGQLCGLVIGEQGYRAGPLD